MIRKPDLIIRWLWPLLISLGALLFFIGGMLFGLPESIEAKTQQPVQILTNLNTPPQVFSLVSLKVELDTDPQGYGYATMSHFEAAQALNLFRIGEVVTRGLLSVQTLQSQVIISEYVSLTNVERSGWQAILTASSDGGVNIDNQAIRDQAAAIWGPGTITRGNLVAIQTRSGSRVEALYGEGFVATDKQVEEARLLP